MPRLRRDRRPSCLALVTDAFGGTGGIARYNRDFLAALAASAIFSTIAVLPRHPGEPVKLPERITQTRPHRGRPRYALAAMIATLKQRPDLVFCGHPHLAPLAWAIARLARARLIAQTHGIEVWRAPSRLRRQALEAADLVLSVSRHTRAAVLGWADIPPERVVVVSNAVGEVFTPGDGSTRRAAWRLAGKTVLLTVGRLDRRERYKGHDKVIEAIPELVARGHDIAYLVIGEGDDRPRLNAIAARLGVAERVRFAGFVAPETLVEAYRMADLFVMPSTGEGFGIAFIEAMACGTPALGLAVGGACDALGDGELGTALGRNDDLAAAIDRLLTEPRACPRELADRTRARFGPEAFASRLSLALERVCRLA
jgi:phosphatidylinositol alpha-1,6-mannosyltransferase